MYFLLGPIYHLPFTRKYGNIVYLANEKDRKEVVMRIYMSCGSVAGQKEMEQYDKFKTVSLFSLFS